MIGTNLAITTKNYAASGAVAYDADALAYFTANTAITSSADKNAINDFYLGLKSDGIYTKIKAMYLPIWGSSATCKWNLVNPLDTNAAFRLTFSTGWAFSSGGMTPTNAYANTNLIPSSVLSTNSTHISYYSRTDNDTGIDMGVNSNNSIGRIYTYIRLSNLFGGRNNNTTSGEKAITNTNGLGHYINNRIDSGNIKLVKNGSTTTLALTSNGLDPVQITIGAIYDISSYFYGSKQCSFASIGDGLTDVEANNFYNRVNTLMTYFGINV